MLTEISLNILDIAENSVRARASLVEITIQADTRRDSLKITIKDNGCGMTEAQLKQAEDPFFTTRTTRKQGFGISFFKQAALMTGGSFQIGSKPGKGTQVQARFVLSHIDRMPLGDITASIHTLVIFHQQTDFVYSYKVNEKAFTLDTRELKKILGNVPFNVKEVSDYIREYLKENKEETDGGIVI